MVRDAVGTLVLHMLHRHGLAPLVASRDGGVANFMASYRAQSTGSGDLQAFVQQIEQFKPVKRLRGLLESLTLAGLRSLHGYDHDWSMSRMDVLQAGHSAHTYQFMQNYGFTHNSCSGPIS